MFLHWDWDNHDHTVVPGPGLGPGLGPGRRSVGFYDRIGVELRLPVRLLGSGPRLVWAGRGGAGRGGALRRGPVHM